MARVRHSPEQIINKLRAIEVHLSSGITQEQAVRKEEVSVQTYFGRYATKEVDRGADAKAEGEFSPSGQ